MPVNVKRASRAFVTFVAVAAVAWVALFYGYFIRLYFATGRVPRGKGERLRAGLENSVHDWAVAWLLGALIVLFAPWAVAYLVCRARGRIGPILAFLLPAGWVLIGLIFVVDPGGLWWDVYFD